MIDWIKFKIALRTLVAYIVFPVWGAKKTGDWLGVIPFIPASSSQFAYKRFPPPKIFHHSQVTGSSTNQFWDRPTPSKLTLNETLLVPNGSADSSGFVFTAKGYPILKACHPLRQRRKYRWRRLRDGIPVHYRQQVSEPYHYPGRIGVLTSAHQHMYAHWILDVLPRLARLEETAPDPELYYLQNLTPFQADTISMLQLNNIKIVNSAEIPWVTADELIIPCHQILFGYHYPHWVIQWLRKVFLSSDKVPPSPVKRVYISRSLAEKRRVINESEVFALLADRGFEFFCLEKLSVAAQASLFHGAEVIVSPHGSGLANLVFCNAEVKVIELFPSRATDAYFRLCQDMGLTYSCIKTRERSRKPRVSDDFTIDVEDLRLALEG